MTIVAVVSLSRVKLIKSSAMTRLFGSISLIIRAAWRNWSLVCPGTRIDTVTARTLGRVAAAIVLLGVRLGVVFLVTVRSGVTSSTYWGRNSSYLLVEA